MTALDLPDDWTVKTRTLGMLTKADLLRLKQRDLPDALAIRCTTTERVLYEAGFCGWLVVSGMPGMEWCGQSSSHVCALGHCRRHHEAYANDHGKCE